MLFQNSFLEGVAENINFCGGEPRREAILPQDITIKGNIFSKPSTWGWGGGPYIVKTLIEFKCGLRVLIEGNTLEEIGYDNGGTAFRLTVRAESSNSTWMELSDVTIRYNLIRNTVNGFNTFAADDDGTNSMHSKRWTIHDNLIYGLGTHCGGGATCGYLYWMTNGGATCTDSSTTCKMEDLTFRHNTIGAGITQQLLCPMLPGELNLTTRIILLMR